MPKTNKLPIIKVYNQRNEPVSKYNPNGTNGITFMDESPGKVHTNISTSNMWDITQQTTGEYIGELKLHSSITRKQKLAIFKALNTALKPSTINTTVTHIPN